MKPRDHFQLMDGTRIEVAQHVRLCRGRMSVMANRIAIESALANGQSIRMIFETYRTTIPVTYSTFARHVTKILRKKVASANQSGASAGRVRNPILSAKPGKAEDTGAGDTRRIGRPRFVFDPDYSSTKDLIG